jgi:hypothetical protein
MDSNSFLRKKTTSSIQTPFLPNILKKFSSSNHQILHTNSTDDDIDEGISN